MKKWGLLVTSYYVVTVIAMMWPLFFNVVPILFSNEHMTWWDYCTRIRDLYGEPWFAVPVAIVFLGQLLLLASVDRSSRQVKPQSHIFWPAALSGLFTAVLAFGLFTSIAFTIKGDHFVDYFGENLPAQVIFAVIWPLVWLIWGIVFYVRERHTENPLSRATNWLLKGSILEFLVVVPCHVIVRRRDECCAPIVTSLGMCTGLAIMLIAFGPGVWFLYRKQMQSYKRGAAIHQ